MTNRPEQPFGGIEYPSLEQSRPPVDPYVPMDYPEWYPALPPPVYPGYPTAYPAPFPGNPGDPYRMAAPAGTNGKAIGSLVASLLGLFFCGLPSVAGIVLGVIAMRATRRSGQDGYGMALAGTVIGGFVAAMWLMFLLLWLVGVLLALNAPAYS